MYIPNFWMTRTCFRGSLGAMRQNIASMINRFAGGATVALVAVLNPLTIALPAFADVAPPKIEIAQPLFDFGVVPEGTRVKHDFEVSNVGGAELIIQQVVPSCGCTAAIAQDPKIAAAGKSVIHVEFDTTGFSGEKTKQARINSNDPVTPSTFVTLKGTVDTDLSFDPERIQLGEFVSGADSVLPEVKVVARSKGSSQIVSVMPGSPSLELAVVRSSPFEWEFTVKPAAGIAPGDVRDRIIVGLAKGDEKRETNIPVIGKAAGPIMIKPSSVAMGILEGDAPIERRVQIESRRRKPFVIRSIESDNPVVKVTQKSIETGKALVLIVRVDPRELKADLRSTVTVTFDDAALAPLQFSVYGVRPPTVD